MTLNVLRTATIVFAVALSIQATTVSAATFVVNDTGNSSDSSIGNGVCRTSGGVCTLRAAIQEANATTALDVIEFGLGSGPRRITVTSSLPTITRPVTINGWSQPGWVDVPLIEIRGNDTLNDGLVISGGGSTLRGLVINSFGGDGVFLSGPGGNVIEGCYIGLSADGSEKAGNRYTGVRIESPNNRIGGRELSQRNVISGNRGRDILGGVFIYGASATGNIIQGNFIGLDATGMFGIGNEQRGVAIHDAPGNFVGGALPGAGNLIAANRATGVRMWGQADGNTVQGNYIGMNRIGETRLGLWPEPDILSNARGVQMRSDNNVVADNVIVANTYDGVIFYDGTDKDYNPLATASNNLVYNNTIAFNGLNGIGVYKGTGNRFIANSIYENGAFGINLALLVWDEVDANDVGDGDDGANRRQNYPVLQSVTTSATQATVAGSLNSTPDGTYLVILYANPGCDPSGHGQGRYTVGGLNVTTNAAGVASFTTVLGFPLPKGWVLTATAMDAAGNTSEFSACAVVR